MKVENTEVIHKFIVLEGLDGAGTTTQLNMIEKEFNRRGIPHYVTFEPTSGPIGRLIRKALSKEITLHPASLAQLYVADRHEHLFGCKGILEHIETGDVVLSDRYLFSSLAYQSVDCGFDFVRRINGLFPLPELLIFIDAEPELCQQRLSTRGNAELFDDLQFQKRVRSAYKTAFSLFDGSKMTVKILDGSLAASVLLEKIWDIFAEMSIIRV